MNSFMRLFILVGLCSCICSLLPTGQEEDPSHGPHSPHEKRTKAKEHYKDGEHNADFDHEAVLGSRSEADSYDQLSPDESKKRLRLLCAKMDVNTDGFVDKTELTDWIEKSLKQLDVEEVDDRFDEIDEDGDGGITWEEYKKESFDEDNDDDDDSEMDEEDKRLLAEDHRYFMAADVDGDGKMSKEEFSAFQNPEGFDHMFPSLLKATLGDKDKDGDGKINLDEFLGEGFKEDEEWMKLERGRFQKEYDLDSNGLLDETEMKAWLIPNLRQTAEEETTHLMSSSDSDTDSKLSYDEIVNQHELFVGSEATNYGEHLESMKHEEL